MSLLNAWLKFSDKLNEETHYWHSTLWGKGTTCMYDTHILWHTMVAMVTVLGCILYMLATVDDLCMACTGLAMSHRSTNRSTLPMRNSASTHQAKWRAGSNYISRGYKDTYSIA